MLCDPRQNQRATLLVPTFGRGISPDLMRLSTSAAVPIALFLLAESDCTEAAAHEMSSSTTLIDEEAGTVTRACRRRRQDRSNTFACELRESGQLKRLSHQRIFFRIFREGNFYRFSLAKLQSRRDSVRRSKYETLHITPKLQPK